MAWVTQVASIPSREASGGEPLPVRAAGEAETQRREAVPLGLQPGWGHGHGAPAAPQGGNRERGDCPLEPPEGPGAARTWPVARRGPPRDPAGRTVRCAAYCFTGPWPVLACCIGRGRLGPCLVTRSSGWLCCLGFQTKKVSGEPWTETRTESRGDLQV